MVFEVASIIGHGDMLYCDVSEIKTAMLGLIERNKCKKFLFGGMGKFDTTSAYCLWEIKKTHPHIKSCLVIPYLSFRVQDEFLYDEIIFPEELEGAHFKKTITLRNRYLIEHSNVAICCVLHSFGGAFQTYQYAKKRGLSLIELPKK